MGTNLSDMTGGSGSSSGQHEGEEELVLLKEPPLHLVKDEAHGKAGEQAQAHAHVWCLLTGVNAVVEHGDVVGEGGLVHGRDEGQISHHKVEGGGTCCCRPILLPGLCKTGSVVKQSSVQGVDADHMQQGSYEVADANKQSWQDTVLGCQTWFCGLLRG